MVNERNEEPVMKKKRLRIERVIFVIACLVFVTIALTRIMAQPDPYKQYKEVSMDLKTIGEPQTIAEELSDTKLRFLHYPEFDQEKTNQIISDMIKELPDAEGITFLDYESYTCGDQYESVLFHYRLFDMNQQLQTEYYQGFTFDKEDGDLVSLNEVLRRNYNDLIKEQFQKQKEVAEERERKQKEQERFYEQRAREYLDRIQNATNILVTTCDLKRDYEIIRPDGFAFFICKCMVRL